MSQSGKSLSKGGLYYLGYNILKSIFPFISGIYVAQVLLPDGIGRVAAAQNLTQYFVILAFLGIPTYGLREIAKCSDDQQKRSRVYSELMVINFFSTIFFLIIYCLLITIVQEYRENYLLYFITGISIVLNVLNNDWLFEALEEYKFYSINSLIFKLICFILLLLFVHKPEDYIKYALIAVIGTCGNYIVNIVVSPRFVSFSLHNLDLKRHVKPILYLVTVNLAIELYSLTDITMMNFYCTKDSIAFYKYGSSIQKVLLQIVNTFTYVLIPRITYYYNNNRIDDYNNLLSKGLKLVLIVSLPMIIGIQFTADFLVQSLYGPLYLNASRVLKGLSILLLINPIGYLLGSRVLLVTNHEKKMVYCVGVGALLNVIGNMLLIPRYSEYGATIASVISEIVVMVVYLLTGKPFFKLVRISKTICKVVVSCSIMVLYLSLCVLYIDEGWIRLIIQIIGSVILYFGILICIKEEVTIQYARIIKHKLISAHHS